MEFNLAQKRIINARANGIKLIKGEVSCGKTVSAIKRAFKLQQLYCVNKDDDILILAKDSHHLKALESIHESILSKAIIQKSFFDDENKKKLEMNNINSIILSYFSRYNENHKTDYSIADIKVCREALKEAIKKVKEKSGSVYKNIKFFNEEYVEFFMDEIKWIKECIFTEENDYYECDRSSRLNIKYGKEEKLIKIRKNSKARKCIFNIMTEYNRILRDNNLVDFEDAALYAAEQCKNEKNKKYTHIVVDEVQNFTRSELQIIDTLYNKKMYSTLTLVLDTDRLDKCCGWINKKRKFSSLGYNVKGKSVTLKEKFIMKDDAKKHLSKLNVHKKPKAVKKHNRNDDKQYSYSLLSFDLSNIEKCTDHDSNNIFNSENNMLNTNKINENIAGESMMDFETIKYIDLNRNVCHEFITDFYECGEVYTSDDNFKNRVEEVVTIPVFNEIAAGSPILMNDEVEYSCNIPKSWIRGSKDLFILKIKGDSMVMKNINDGDHVLINKNKYPCTNDVVAVEIEGEATLKTFKTKGKYVILKPENDKYDPIILNGEQEYSILGVAVGILKNFS
ncbi:LexA family protein [Clostridium butyricum]|uniref:LexA family protein n=1 Tax=Clostridium butyricum TaxID=1492 RepID=UPI002AB09141|nr:S24 family peptidase [Clostridium butyricum]